MIGLANALEGTGLNRQRDWSPRNDPRVMDLFAALRALSLSARAELRSVMYIGRGDYGAEAFPQLKQRTLRQVALGEDSLFTFGDVALLADRLRKGAGLLRVDLS